MVMHELLRDGKEKVIQMFKDMKKEFKGKYFFLGEFDCAAQFVQVATLKSSLENLYFTSWC